MPPVQKHLAVAIQRVNHLKLRPYQSEAKADIYQAWAGGALNVLAVLPTGAGKTVTFSDIIHDHRGASCAIAHRQELVAQISLALARDRVRHRIIGPTNVVKLCVNLHMAELGASYYAPNATCAVAGVDTLVRKNGSGRDGERYAQKLSDGSYQMWGPRVGGRWLRSSEGVALDCKSGPKPPRDRDPEVAAWADTVTLWVQDEAHHVLEDNKWGTAASMFPNGKGLGVTATPLRADGRGLGRHADGVFDVMVEGPGMRDLIDAGYLTDYRVFAPPSDLDLSAVSVSKTTGDFNPNKLKTAVRESHVVGDVVDHYLRIAPGKLGVTFATDVQTATDIAAKFNEAGVPAQVVSANTPDADRIAILRRFKNRELLQLVNVDLFGEGFDLPAIEVVSMARPTQSFSLFVQQFGRALRLMIDASLYPHWDGFTAEQRRAHIAASSKPTAIIIDHVGNCSDRHGLPDAVRVWTLDRRERRSKSTASDVIPVRACVNPTCTAVYERIYAACPYCGHKPVPAARSGPEQVDGDLIELDAAALAELRGANGDRVDKDKEDYRAELAAKHVPLIAQMAHVKRHVENQAAQVVLRDAIGWWAAWERAKSRPDSESYRRFYFKFGVDVETAKGLGTADALALAEKVKGELPDANA